MRGPLPALAALLLAGCLTAPAPPADPGAAGPGTGGWALDCTLGQHERALGNAWAQDCLARASHTEGPKQEIWLAVNPLDPDNVVLGAKDNNPESSAGCTWNGVSVTKDGGRTWTDVVIGGRYADRQPGEPWFGYGCNTDPMLAFGLDGAVHYGVEVYNFLGRGGYGATTGTPLQPIQGNNSLLTPGWKVLLATSRDGGLTWPEVITLQPDLVTVTDYSRMAVSPATGTILHAINNIGTGITCHVLSSRDGGRSADPPVKATVPQDPGLAQCRGLAVSPAGTVVLAFPTGEGEETAMVFVRSTDDGRTFLDAGPGFRYRPIPGTFEESQYRTGTNFELAYDLSEGPRRGTLYAIYADASGGDADVWVRSSPDDGRTWGEPARVNDDATGHHQFMPNVAVAGDGSVHGFFMDKRWDPGNKLIDVTHAVSLDGGLAWANRRVTSQSFDGDLGRHQRGFPFIGDYIGAGASGDVVWGGFPDASDGASTVVAAARVARGP